MITGIRNIEINHPIFGDDCQVEFSYEAKFIPADIEDGYIKQYSYFEINKLSVTEINNKKYTNKINNSMASFLLEKYSLEINELLSENADYQKYNL